MAVAIATSIAIFAFLAITVAKPADAAVRTITLGASTVKHTPNCGSSFVRDCTAEGKVTGFQVLASGQKSRSFVVPFAGRIVSWSISLAVPTRREITEKTDPPITHQAQLPFFNDLFGSPASARISVLKQVQKAKKGQPHFEMVRQSPTQILNPYFGTTVHFALNKPLNVIPNQIVALTLPTWAPAYWAPRACNVITSAGDQLDPTACAAAGEKYTWRGSRADDKCVLGQIGDFLDNLNASRPQQKVNSVKPYGCYYQAGQFLYTATIVGQH